MGTFNGKVHHIGGVEQISEKFKKRVLVVNDGHAEYPQTVPFSFVQDNVDKLNSLKVGDSVEVSYDLRGREWKGKYFADVNGWKVEVTQSAATSAPAPPPAAAKVMSPQEAAFEEDDQELPF